LEPLKPPWLPAGGGGFFTHGPWGGTTTPFTATLGGAEAMDAKDRAGRDDRGGGSTLEATRGEVFSSRGGICGNLSLKASGAQARSHPTVERKFERLRLACE